MTFFHPGKSEEKMVVRPLRVQGDQGGEDQERVVPQQRCRITSNQIDVVSSELIIFTHFFTLYCPAVS